MAGNNYARTTPDKWKAAIHAAVGRPKTIAPVRLNQAAPTELLDKAPNRTRTEMLNLVATNQVHPHQVDWAYESANRSGEVAAPIAVGHVLPEGRTLMKMEPSVTATKEGNLVIIGSEMIKSVVIPASMNGTIPAGTALTAPIPVNPMALPYTREQIASRMWDQWRYKMFVVEYVPFMSTSDRGGIVSAMTTSANDNPSMLSGDASLRALTAKQGAASGSLWLTQATSMNVPQQKWYFVETDEADLAVAGQYWLMAATDFATSATTSLTLGVLWVHYELEFRAPTVSGNAPIVTDARFAAAIFSTTALTANTTMFINVADLTAAGGWPAAAFDPTYITTLVVYSYVDPGAGPSWRSVTDPNSGAIISLTPGRVIYARAGVASAGQPILRFYGSYADAYEGSAVGPYGASSPLTSTVTTAAGVHSLGFGNISCSMASNPLGN